jgi:prepilin-type processing-associated H-X9-DG protein
MNDHESYPKDAHNAQIPDSQSPCEDKRLDVKTCRLAVASCVAGILSLPICVIGAFPENLSTILPVIGFGLGLLAFVLGIVSFHIMAGARGMLTGKGFAAIGMAIPLGLFSFAVFTPILMRHSIAYRLYCGTNLSGIGKAMLIYANDFDDQFPRAAGPNSKWGPTPNWQAVARAEAYGLNDGPGQATISANFYLLVKYTEVSPKSFICKGDTDKDKGDKGATEFTLSKYKVRGKDFVDLWDFGPDPSKHCSYTYHIPYGPYPLTTSSDPSMAVASDRNPWLASPSRHARSNKDFQAFDPNGTRECIKRGNAFEHREDGQNVLFVDGHTSFEKESFYDVNDDNIYTVQNGADIKKGIRPTLDSQPANKNDSVLVHDPPKGDGK